VPLDTAKYPRTLKRHVINPCPEGDK